MCQNKDDELAFIRLKIYEENVSHYVLIEYAWQIFRRAKAHFQP
jgi:hypothetical protein